MASTALKIGSARIAGGKLIDEPFRLFFPLGCLWGLLGVGFWGARPFLPFLAMVSTRVHVWLVIYGFLGSFVVGFLGTALPRFSRTRHLTVGEVAVHLALFTAAPVCVLFGKLGAAHICFLLAMIAFTASALPRFLRAKGEIPPTFVYIPFALVAGMVGAGVQGAQALGWRWQAFEMYTLSTNLLCQGMAMLLLVGVGGFMIRSILGWLTLRSIPEGEAPDFDADPPSRVKWHVLGACLVLVSFVIEIFVHRAWGAALRAVVVTAEAVWQMQAHRRPVSGKMGAQWLRVALGLLVLGMWTDAIVSPLYPAYRLAILHLCFIGGFSMAIFVIATRVVLSHGGFPKLIARAYRPLTAVQVLLFIGCITRVGADAAPASYTRHLVYAALCWCAGVVVWCCYVLVKISVQEIAVPGDE